MNQPSGESAIDVLPGAKGRDARLAERNIALSDFAGVEPFEFPLPASRPVSHAPLDEEERERDRNRFEDPDWTYRIKRLLGYAGLALTNLRFITRWLMGGIPAHEVYRPHDLSPTFFGLNCPPSSSPDIEDFLFQCIQELGVKTVRMDWGPQTDRVTMDRWLTRLTEAGIEPLIHLVQCQSEASRMSSPEAKRQWEAFVGDVMDSCGGRANSFEIGSTPNRHSWSGYTVHDYAEACGIAQDVASREGVEILGPNVSDFAPYFSVGLLDACKKRGVRFAAMTNNLFCDRAGSPETHDPSVKIGLPGTDLKMDLVGKSATLWAVARAYNIPRLYSTYSYYTLSHTGKPRRSRRRQNRHVSLEDYSRYLVQYYILSAAVGALDRVYWGNIACNRKGVVDDGFSYHPYPPTVHHKYCNFGAARDYRKRESFQAFKTVVHQIKGSRFARALSKRDPFIFEFKRNGTTTIVGWSNKPEGEAAPQLDEMWSRDWVILDRNGREVSLSAPIRLNGSPLYFIRDS